jgi:uncharacterized protein YcbX
MRLAGLCFYPVKGMRGIDVEAADVEPCGLAWDRRWMVVAANGRFLTQRQLPAMARLDATLSGGALMLAMDRERIMLPLHPPAEARSIRVTVWRSTLDAVLVGDAADRWLTRHLGQPCRLVFLADAASRPIEPAFARLGEHVSFADGFPILLTSTGSLAVLNAALERRIGMDRFRPNLVVDGAAAWAEDGWRLLRIGGLRFRAAKPCTRCAVPGIDQRSGEVPCPGEPLRTLGRLNRQQDGIVFGCNLVPLQPGRLHLGDPVEILE